MNKTSRESGTNGDKVDRKGTTTRKYEGKRFCEKIDYPMHHGQDANENARFVLMNVNCIGKRLSFERNVESQGNVKDWKLYPYMNMTFVPSGPFSRISYEL